MQLTLISVTQKHIPRTAYVVSYQFELFLILTRLTSTFRYSQGLNNTSQTSFSLIILPHLLDKPMDDRAEFQPRLLITSCSSVLAVIHSVLCWNTFELTA